VEQGVEVGQVVDEGAQHEADQLELVHAEALLLQVVDLPAPSPQLLQAIAELTAAMEEHSARSQPVQFLPERTQLEIELSVVLEHRGIDPIAVVRHILRVVPQHKGIDGKVHPHLADRTLLPLAILREDAAHLDHHHQVDQAELEVHKELKGFLRLLRGVPELPLQMHPLQRASLIDGLEVHRIGHIGHNHGGILNCRIGKAHIEEQLQTAIQSVGQGAKVVAKVAGKHTLITDAV